MAARGESPEGRREALRSLEMLADFADHRNAALKNNFSLLLGTTEYQYLIELLKEQVAEHGDGTAQTILAQLLADKEAK